MAETFALRVCYLRVLPIQAAALSGFVRRVA